MRFSARPCYCLVSELPQEKFTQTCFPHVDQIEQSSLMLLFQQDSAPPHFSLAVRDALLNGKFSNRWISRASPEKPSPGMGFGFREAQLDFPTTYRLGLVA